MAYKGRVKGGGSDMVQKSRDGIAVVGVVRIGSGIKWMIDCPPPQHKKWTNVLHRPKPKVYPPQSIDRDGGGAAPAPQPGLTRSEAGTTVRTTVTNLHVEYEERGTEHGILFIFSLLCEYIHLEYVRIHVIYRVYQAEFVIHILAVAPHEYVNLDSTRRVTKLCV